MILYTGEKVPDDGNSEATLGINDPCWGTEQQLGVADAFELDIF